MPDEGSRGCGRRVRDFFRRRVFGAAMKGVVSVFALVSILLALVAPAAMGASEPAVSTGNATAITFTWATLNGTINPEGQATSYYFEYGTTTSYGSQTTTAEAGSGTADVGVSGQSASLAPDTTYHYRLVATNASGTTLGSDVSFKTPTPPAPLAATGRPAAVTETTATLTGTVDPKGPSTSYFFQYGKSTAYGSQTPAGSVGPGTETVAVSAAIGPLTPNTTYHYRLVARSANGTTRGRDVSLKTAAVPGQITIGSAADPITFGQLTSVTGRVPAPRPPRPAVTLQRAATADGPWIDAASTTADSSGAYSFSHVAPSANTYYRALSDGATSASLLISVRFRVGLVVSRRHPRAGTLVRFYGHVAPGHSGHLVLLERLGPRGRWQTIRFLRLRGFGTGSSSYSVRLRIRRSGRWRVVVVADATHAAGVSATVRVRVR
jgi:hypothetical protein